MRIKSNTWEEIGRLFSCLEYGERISHDCAARQANFRGVANNRFFVRQARQELYHAKVFNRVILCITPRGPKQVPLSLQQCRVWLDRACRRGDLVETLVGQQIVLEGLGELILDKLDQKFDQRRIGFKRVRTVLLNQERGHHAFGQRMVCELIASDKTNMEHVNTLATEYLALIDRILCDLQPVFDVVDANADRYKMELRERLPDWLVIES